MNATFTFLYVPYVITVPPVGSQPQELDPQLGLLPFLEQSPSSSPIGKLKTNCFRHDTLSSDQVLKLFSLNQC